MSDAFRSVQSANRGTHNELQREKRRRALNDAFIERRLELAGIPDLSEAEKAAIRADINKRFPVDERQPGEDE